MSPNHLQVREGLRLRVIQSQGTMTFYLDKWLFHEPESTWNARCSWETPPMLNKYWEWHHATSSRTSPRKMGCATVLGIANWLKQHHDPYWSTTTHIKVQIHMSRLQSILNNLASLIFTCQQPGTGKIVKEGECLIWSTFWVFLTESVRSFIDPINLGCIKNA